MGKTIAQKALEARSKTAGKKAIDLDDPEQEKKGFEMYATGKSPYTAGQARQYQTGVTKEIAKNWKIPPPGPPPPSKQDQFQDKLVAFYDKLGQDPGYEMPDYAPHRAAEKARIQREAGEAARRGGVAQVGGGGGRYGSGQIGAAKIFGDVAGQYIGVDADIAARQKEDWKLRMDDERARENLMLQALLGQGQISSAEMDFELKKQQLEDNRFNDGMTLIGEALTNLQAQYGPLDEDERAAFEEKAYKALDEYIKGDRFAFAKAGIGTLGSGVKGASKKEVA